MTAVAVLVGVAVAVWLTLPTKPDALPRALVLFLGVLVFGSILPTAANVVVQFVALAGALLLWLSLPSEDRRGGAVVLWSVVVIGVWALLVLHPNVPDVTTGLLGFRKTVLAVGGLILGCSITKHHVLKVELLAVRLLALALVVSIAGYLWVPEIEQLVNRQASEFTGVYEGQARLQGVFAGPFHAAMAAVLLLGWATFRFRRHRALTLLVGLIAGAALVMTAVRTAYVAAAVVVLANVLLASSIRTFWRRLTGLLLMGVLAAGVFWLGDSASTTVQSIGGYSTDQRFQNRFAAYTQGLALFLRSPGWGWGAGSAGDTLESAFGVGYEHVTSHNLLLKVAVEGGVVGVAAWGGLLVALWRALDRRTAQASLAIISGLGLLAFGTTGSAIEALPVSYLLFLMVGLGVSESRRGDRRGGSPNLARSGRVRGATTMPGRAQAAADLRSL